MRYPILYRRTVRQPAEQLSVLTTLDCRWFAIDICGEHQSRSQLRPANVGLREVQFREDYRSGYDDILDDFFRPSLSHAKEYWRAVGYFSSSSLESFGTPLGEFVKNDGRIRLVTSVELSEADLNAISEGVSRKSVCMHRLEKIIEEDFVDGVGDGVTRLGRLLEMERLEVRIAVPKSGTGIYHEKIGLFFDDDDFVAFSGSSNESRRAYENNRECIDVYTSWNSASRAQRKRLHFESLWNRTDQGVDVFGFSDAVRRKLIKICRGGERDQRPHVHEDERWRHQDEAVQAFLAAERGVLNMATGTGKTRTALKILAELLRRNEIDSTIVCTDGNDLLDQWYGTLLAARKTSERVLRIFRHYRGAKETQGFVLEPKDSILLVSREPIASALRQITREQAARTLLVYDEVHGLGSPGNRERLAGLSDNVRFRLGLSATPERTYDREGNDFISNHIGPVLVTFGLKEAIERGILAPFKYFPLSFELTDGDRERIAAVYRRRAAREREGMPMSETELWIELARVNKTSEAKLPVFLGFMTLHHDLLKRSIIFVETMDYGNAVREMVHKYRADFHTYYSGEDSETLSRFAKGELECLITCHRLSEGIDIKSLNTVILFSSERARLETIQRIGRCLRIDPNQQDKVANIVDFVRESEVGDALNADEERRDWLIELSKVRPTE